MSKIALIDLSIIFRQNWHATEHEPMGAAFSLTIEQIKNYCENFNHAAICIDRPPYIRNEIAKAAGAPEYKGGREKVSEVLIGQQKAVIKRLEDDGYLILGALGFEADDIIATCARALFGRDEGYEIVVFSGDKDLLQLVNDHVSVVSTGTHKKLDAAAVVERFGVRPDQMVDYLAILGDKSDNISGIPGAGKVAAAMWLNEHNTITGFCEAYGMGKAKANKKQKEALDDDKTWKMLGTAVQLITLRADAPIDVSAIFEKREVKKLTDGPSFDDDDETPETPEGLEDAMNTPIDPITEPGVIGPSGEKIMTVTSGNGIGWSRALEPGTAKEAYKVAHHIFNARLFEQFQSPEAIWTIILTGRSMGLDAVSSLRNFHMIKGKVSPSAATLVGLVKRSPVCKYFMLEHSDHEKAQYCTHREGEPKPTVMTYTIDDARTAGLLGNKNWQARPKTMLRWRCSVELARAVYPDLTAGLYSVDEIEDMGNDYAA